jgi:hypothetical protein
MIPEFQNLKDNEIELVYKAPIVVCILIAGADGTIDKKEIKGAIQFAEKKHRRSLSSVATLFKEIGTDFEDKLKILVQSYPFESTQRNPLVIEELSELNELWLKLERSFTVEYYQTLRDIAEKIASSSGGLLGYKSVGAEEAKYMTLPMVKDPSTG